MAQKAGTLREAIAELGVVLTDALAKAVQNGEPDLLTYCGGFLIEHAQKKAAAAAIGAEAAVQGGAIESPEGAAAADGGPDEPPHTTPAATEESQVAASPPASEMVALPLVSKGGSEEPSYQQYVDEWTEDATYVPIDLLVNVTGAAISQIGPRTIEKDKADNLVKELEANQKAMKENHNEAGKEKGSDDDNKRYITLSSKLELQLDAAREAAGTAETSLQTAMSHLRTTKLSTSARVAVQLEEDNKRYQSALKRLSDEEPGEEKKLTELVERLTNVGELRLDQVVVVIHEGEFRKAKVIKLPDDEEPEYEVSLWKEYFRTGKKYEEGYDTRSPDIEKRERSKIYTSGKDHQELSPDAVAVAKAVAKKAELTYVPLAKNDIKFLMLLYFDAERALVKLNEFGKSIKDELKTVNFMPAPLKKSERASVKALEKYHGCYDELTDLARFTIECLTFSDVRKSLELINRSKAVELLRIKHRLCFEYDASPTGGYRDMLINVREVNTGHICEVQLTLKPLLEIKKGRGGGGHEAYKLARQLQLNEKASYYYEGALTSRVVQQVDSGLIKELVIQGRAANLTKHFDGFLNALNSTTCTLRMFELGDCDWPKGRSLAEPMAAVVSCKGLKHCAIHDMEDAKCEFEDSFFESFASAGDNLYISKTALMGRLPPSVGKCVNIRSINLGWNQLSGPIPAELGLCVSLHTLKLHKNKFSGEIPDVFHALKRLKVLFVQNNELTGPVPPSIGECKELESFFFSFNDIEGTFPIEAMKGLDELDYLECKQNPKLTITRDERRALFDTLPSLSHVSWPDMLGKDKNKLEVKRDGPDAEAELERIINYPDKEKGKDKDGGE